MRLDRALSQQLPTGLPDYILLVNRKVLPLQHTRACPGFVPAQTELMLGVNLLLPVSQLSPSSESGAKRSFVHRDLIRDGSGPYSVEKPVLGFRLQCWNDLAAVVADQYKAAVGSVPGFRRLSKEDCAGTESRHCSIIRRRANCAVLVMLSASPETLRSTPSCSPLDFRPLNASSRITQLRLPVHGAKQLLHTHLKES